MFPVVAINSLAGQEGFAEDKEFNEQVTAINLYVNQINDRAGSTAARSTPSSPSRSRLNDANMQALCQQWTEGNPAAFAVVDGIGTWEGTIELCVTQQGQTPLISAWSTAPIGRTWDRRTFGGRARMAPSWWRPCSGA